MLYKELNEMKLRVILIIAVLVISLITTIVMRPYASQMMSEMAGQLEELPDFLKKLIGDTSSLTKLDDDNYYLLSQWQG